MPTELVLPAMETILKHPSEVRDQPFDFSLQPEIAAGQTITGAGAVSLTAVSGDGAAPTATPSIDAGLKKVNVALSGGTAGTLGSPAASRWLLRLYGVTTSGGKTLETGAWLVVRNVG